MATHTDDHGLPYDKDGGEWHRGDQIIDEQRATYDVFMGLTKWGGLAVIAVVAWATMTFATEAGFLTGVFVAAVIVVLGVLLLREKKSDHAGDRRP